MKTMSIVLPAYNEEQMIEKTAGTIARLMAVSYTHLPEKDDGH